MVFLATMSYIVQRFYQLTISAHKFKLTTYILIGCCCCHDSYEIQEEGPVQLISYVSDTEVGHLRLVSQQKLVKEKPRFVARMQTGFYAPIIFCVRFDGFSFSVCA